MLWLIGWTPGNRAFRGKLSQQIQIENREKKYTSRKAAVSFVARGIAKWISDTSIRFLESPEQFAIRTARQDGHYWREVAAQRGGDDAIFEWGTKTTPAYAGAMFPELGTVGRCARIIATKRN